MIVSILPSLPYNDPKAFTPPITKGTAMVDDEDLGESIQDGAVGDPGGREQG
jgi:hypothetical protein